MSCFALTLLRWFCREDFSSLFIHRNYHGLIISLPHKTAAAVWLLKKTNKSQTQHLPPKRQEDRVREQVFFFLTTDRTLQIRNKKWIWEIGMTRSSTTSFSSGSPWRYENSWTAGDHADFGVLPSSCPEGSITSVDRNSLPFNPPGPRMFDTF